MSDSDLCYMPATELATAVRTKQVSPVEVVNAILARIEQLNPRLNAYCLVTADAARQAAQAAEQAVMRGEVLVLGHRRGVDDLSRIHDVEWIERLLDVLEGTIELRPE